MTVDDLKKKVTAAKNRPLPRPPVSQQSENRLPGEFARRLEEEAKPLGMHNLRCVVNVCESGWSVLFTWVRKIPSDRPLTSTKMKLLGSEVVPVTSGTETLKDAVNEAMGEWVKRLEDTHYCLSSAVGPHPFRKSSGTFRLSSPKKSRSRFLKRRTSSGCCFSVHRRRQQRYRCFLQFH